MVTNYLTHPIKHVIQNDFSNYLKMHPLLNRFIIIYVSPYGKFLKIFGQKMREFLMYFQKYTENIANIVYFYFFK